MFACCNIIGLSEYFVQNVELGITTQSVKTSFENEWDVMPAGRKNFIHIAGVVCPFKVDIYTYDQDGNRADIVKFPFKVI